MNDVIAGVPPGGHPEIRHHHEGFGFVPGNRVLSAVEVGLVNVMSRETVLRQYVDRVKQFYDYVLLDCTPSHEQAIKMRRFSEEGKLNPEVILSIMQEEKPNQVEQFKMPRARISKYFAPGMPAQKIEDTMLYQPKKRYCL